MARPAFPSDAQGRFIIRMPEGMRDKIEAAAKAAGRSMNSEIVARLEASFDQDLEGIEERVSQLETQVADESREVDKRLDRIEANMWRLLEHAGMYDPNPD